MCRGNITRPQGIQPGKRLFRFALSSTFPLVFGVEGMQSLRIGCNLRKAKQNLVEEMGSALGEGNTKQNRKIARLGDKTQALRELFALINNAANGGCKRRHRNDSTAPLF